MQSPHQASNGAVEAAQLQAIRDQFAQAALTGILAGLGNQYPIPHMVTSAWEIADQMMATRDRSSTGNR
jgi:hypothetical protein